MNEVRCTVSGCSEVFKTEEEVSQNSRYICKNHPREVQVRAASRSYNPDTDEADKKVGFQIYQHDRRLNHSTRPVGALTRLPGSPSREVTTNQEEERLIALIDETRKA